MKVILRKIKDDYEIYVAKKDLEEKVVEAEFPTIWGGWIKLANGWRFQMPDMPADTKLPLTIDARKLGEDEE